MEISAQDMQIFQLKAEGRQDDEISQIVKLPPGTVKSRYTAIYKKLGAKNGAEAVKIAEQQGLLPKNSSQKPTFLLSLTARERDVGQEVANGLQNSQIARKLNISVSKVENAIHSLLSKTGCKNRIELAGAMAKIQQAQCWM